jgi:hypothetical protein
MQLRPACLDRGRTRRRDSAWALAHRIGSLYSVCLALGGSLVFTYLLMVGLTYYSYRVRFNLRAAVSRDIDHGAFSRA